jgi:para-nitrobenzyl esterase
MDLPFVFDDTEVAGTIAGAPVARELAGRISDTWIAFARPGNPNNPAIPNWPAYRAADRATMILDTTCRLTHDPDRDANLLWTRVLQG